MRNSVGHRHSLLTDQNGDKTAKPPATLHRGQLPRHTAAAAGPGAWLGQRWRRHRNLRTERLAQPRLSKTGVTGLRSGRVALGFTISEGKRLAKMSALTVELPVGPELRPPPRGQAAQGPGISLKGAKVKSLTLSHGHLVITLRKAVRTVTVRIKASALKESAVLKARAKAKKLKSLRLTVIAKNTKGKRTTIHVQVKQLGL